MNMQTMSEMDPLDCYFVVEETQYGPVVVGAMTAAEIEAQGKEAKPSGICHDIATLPADAQIDMRALGKMFGRSTKSIQRAIRRGDLPRPFRFMGKCVWLAGTIIEHLRSKQQAALEKAAKHAKRLERHAA